MKPFLLCIQCVSANLVSEIECSSLNEHLFQRNLVSNPNCTCGIVEHNNHYLHCCPKYDLACAEMLMTVQQLLPDNIPITSDTIRYCIDGICKPRPW